MSHLLGYMWDYCSLCCLFRTFLLDVNVALIVHSYYIVETLSAAATKTKLVCNLWRVSLISGGLSTLHLGDLKCLLKFEIQSATTFFEVYYRYKC